MGSVSRVVCRDGLSKHFKLSVLPFLQTVLDVMRNCDSLDSRQQVMNAVMKASTEVSTRLNGQALLLGALSTWLKACWALTQNMPALLTCWSCSQPYSHGPSSIRSIGGMPIQSPLSVKCASVYQLHVIAHVAVRVQSPNPNPLGLTGCFVRLLTTLTVSSILCCLTPLTHCLAARTCRLCHISALDPCSSQRSTRG